MAESPDIYRDTMLYDIFCGVYIKQGRTQMTIAQYFNQVIAQPLKENELTKHEFCQSLDLLKVDASNDCMESVYEYLQKRIAKQQKPVLEDDWMPGFSTPVAELCHILKVDLGFNERKA